MAWGGGGGFGPPGGGMRPGQAQPGLPFAGIPPEMMAGVQRLLDKEPEHPEPDVEFSNVAPADQKGFTLKRLLRPHWWALLIGMLLVGVETVTLQIGPQLTQRAIDRGMLAGDFGVVALMAGLYLGSVVLNGLTSAVRVSWTGRLGQRLMKGLRIRVFSHIQRLSLDFFTEEKAGRIMTRMTSDIEALSELLQDGIINLIVQVFTLVFVITVLFSMNVELAFIVTMIIVPIMTIMTLWFRNRSEKAYERVRERIADVMADLQESLSGIRIVAAYNRQRYNEVKHRNVVGDHKVANEGAARVAAVYGPGTESVGTAAQALVLLIGGRMVLRGSLEPGELIAFVLYVSAFFAPIQQLVQLYNMYQSGQAAVAKLRDLLDTDPDVVLMDVRMPRVNGIEAARQIHDKVPSTKILMLTVSDEDQDLFEAIKAGASGYLLKEVSVEEVADSVRAVVQGQTLISPSMASKLLTEFVALEKRVNEKHQYPSPTLTSRELEVLKLVAKGMSNREIADDLFISENTVKNHVRNILEKLHLHSRMEAVIYAVRERLLDINEPDS